MKHCRKWEEQITLFVLGELDAPKAAEVHEHIETCVGCRQLYDELMREEECVAVGIECLWAVDSCSAEQLTRQAGRRDVLGEAARRRTGWGGLTAARMARITAAVVIIAGVIGLIALVVNTGSGSAFAEIVRQIVDSRTCTFTMTSRLDAIGEVMVVRGMFAAPSRMRIEDDGGWVEIMDFKEDRSLTLIRDTNVAMVTQFTNRPPEEAQDQWASSFFNVREMIARAEGSAEYLGQREMQGRAAVGYRVSQKIASTEIWAYADTLLPICIEMSMPEKDFSVVISDFVFNIELDDSLFSLEVPEGYEISEMQVDASLPEEQDLVEMLRLYAEKNDGQFPTELAETAVLQSMDGAIMPPPHTLAPEQKDELRDELNPILADVEANLRQLKAIIEGRASADGLDSLADDIDDSQRRLEELEQRRRSLEDDIHKALTERVDAGISVWETMQETLEAMEPINRGMAFLQTLGPGNDWCYAGAGVTLGEQTVPIFKYKPQDGGNYHILYGDLTVEEVSGDNIPEMPEMAQQSFVSGFDEDDLSNSIMSAYQLSGENEFIWSLGVFTTFCDGSFPPSVGSESLLEISKYQSQRLEVNGESSPELRALSKQMVEVFKKIGFSRFYSESMLFAFCLSAENDFCYAGAGATTSDTDIPIFWYKPNGSEDYRVIYGDLTVESVSAENLPQAPEGSETYEDLHANDPEPEPELPSDANAVAILQQVQARYDAMQTCQAKRNAVTRHTSTAVVDVNELSRMLPEHRRDIVDSARFDEVLTGESTWEVVSTITLTRPSAFLIEYTFNGGNPGAAWYEDGQYHVLSSGEKKSSESPIYGVYGNDAIPEIFYRRLSPVKYLKAVSLLNEETLGGRLCYVITGKMYGGRDITLWIDKDTHMILKSFEIAEYQISRSTPDKEALDKSLSSLEGYDGDKYIERLGQIVQAKIAQKVLLYNEITTTYADIRVDEPVSVEELTPTVYRDQLPSDANAVPE